MTTETKSEYDKQVEKFLKETKTEFKTEFVKWDYHFQDDKEKRDIYKITLKRGGREYSFMFGQSLNASGQYTLYPSMEKIHLQTSKNGEPNKNIKGFGFLSNGNSKKNPEFSVPTAYNVLACLQKYDIGSFKDFYNEFGYSDDSIKAEKIYKAVCDEYNNLKMLYSDDEINKLQEIQ